MEPVDELVGPLWQMRGKPPTTEAFVGRAAREFDDGRDLEALLRDVEAQGRVAQVEGTWVLTEAGRADAPAHGKQLMAHDALDHRAHYADLA